jgi:hypothetical protein
MTPGRAALVILMHRYLAGLFDPFVTLLEVHKAHVLHARGWAAIAAAIRQKTLWTIC